MKLCLIDEFCEREVYVRGVCRSHAMMLWTHNKERWEELVRFGMALPAMDSLAIKEKMVEARRRNRAKRIKELAEWNRTQTKTEL